MKYLDINLYFHLKKLIKMNYLIYRFIHSNHNKYHYLAKQWASNVTEEQLMYFKKEVTNAKFQYSKYDCFFYSIHSYVYINFSNVLLNTMRMDYSSWNDINSRFYNNNSQFIK